MTLVEGLIVFFATFFAVALATYYGVHAGEELISLDLSGDPEDDDLGVFFDDDQEEYEYDFELILFDKHIWKHYGHRRYKKRRAAGGK